MSTAARVEKFHEIHGNSISYDGHYLFEDGASREINPMGAMIDAPADPHTKAKRVELYWRIKLERATDQFHRLRAEIKRGINYAERYGDPPPPQAMFDDLTALQHKVIRLKKNHAKAATAVEQNKPKWLIERAQRLEDNRKAAAEASSQLDRIEI